MSPTQPDHHELIPYRLRTVRVGVIASVVAIGLLTLYPPFAPDGAVTSWTAYYVLLGVAAAAVGGVVMLPWRRLFESRRGLWLMYAWSVGDILIISGEVGVTGGVGSDLWVVYILTTIFFAASYPPRGQIVLLLFTAGAYSVAAGVAGELDVVPLAVRIASLGLLTFMSSFLSRELMQLMGEQLRHRHSAERHAEILDLVVTATRRLQSHDTHEVLEAVVDAVASLGLPWAAIAELDRDGGTFRVVHGRGLPEALERGRHPIRRALLDVLSTGESVTAGRLRGPADGWQDVQSFVVAPIHVRGEVVAVLGGARLDREPVGERVASAVELLASLAGRAIELAGAFEEERETVQHLERLDRLKRDFVSTVSHELRTPLTVMLGVGELLRGRWDEVDEHTRDDLLDRQLAHVGALNRTIATLLDFSRLEAGRLEPQLSQVDLVALIRGCCHRLERLLQRHRLELALPAAADALADPDLLERVVDNLVINAVTHTPPGTSVRVSASADDRGVSVEVADDGPGIAPEELAHVTDRFFRGGDPDTRPTRGLGLGLALVQEILAQHGSELIIESSPGAGARFRFVLPSAIAGSQVASHG